MHGRELEVKTEEEKVVDTTSLAMEKEVAVATTSLMARVVVTGVQAEKVEKEVATTRAGIATTTMLGQEEEEVVGQVAIKVVGIRIKVVDLEEIKADTTIAGITEETKVATGEVTKVVVGITTRVEAGTTTKALVGTTTKEVVGTTTKAVVGTKAKVVAEMATKVVVVVVGMGTRAAEEVIGTTGTTTVVPGVVEAAEEKEEETGVEVLEVTTMAPLVDKVEAAVAKVTTAAHQEQSCTLATYQVISRRKLWKLCSRTMALLLTLTS